ncbi:MAG TPA: hypothetical protein VN175_04650 [Rhizomicrobium sp.]|nr:hypothetical protein [Rhizomicrobium sp.]
MSSTGRREEVHRHSGWLIPGAFLLAILLLSGLFLGWYLRPSFRSQVAPTGQSSLVNLRVHGISFAIPANYIENARARAGGDMNALTLVALFPSWQGYSESQARLFSSNAPDSPLVRLSLRGDPNNLKAEDRLNRVYKPHMVNAEGEAGPFGLTHYGFAPESGYGASDLFAGDSTKGLLLLLCERASVEFPSPSCLAIDRPLAPDLSYSYRFKRAYLGHWREIAADVDRLIAKFRAN